MPVKLRYFLSGECSSFSPALTVATMVAGVMPPSQLLKKFASHPRQHDLAIALREIGRVERTLFIIDWLLDIDMQRRAQIGLNKGESHRRCCTNTGSSGNRVLHL